MAPTYRARRSRRGRARDRVAVRPNRHRAGSIGSFKSAWVTVLRVRAIRRFTVRPVLPEPLHAAGRARRQPALVLAPRDPGPVRGRRPRGVGARPGTTRSGCSARCRRERLDRAGRGPAASCGRLGGRARTSSDYLTGDRWYQRLAQAEHAGAARDRLLLPGVRHHRGAAAVLRRPRHPGRRPPQDRQRPRRADHRRRPALPARLLPAVAVPRRLAAGDATRSSTPTGCRCRCCARPTARSRKIEIGAARRPARSPPGSGSPRSAGCRCCCSTPTSRRTARPIRDGHRPAVRRQHRAPAAPGDAARHRRRARDPRLLPDHRRRRARGVPHQRGPRRLPRPRADPRAHRGRPGLDFDAALEVVPRRHGVHHPHPGARPASTGSRATWSRSTSAATTPAPASRSSGSCALGAEDYEGGDPAMFNMAVMGFRLAQRANGVSQLHGVVSRGMFGGLWPGVRRRRACRSPRSPTACTRPPGWPARSSTWPAPRRAPGPRPDADEPGPGLGRRRQGPRPARSGTTKRVLRERLVDDARRAAARRPGSSAAPPRPSSAGSTRCSTPTCSRSGSRAGSRRTSG